MYFYSLSEYSSKWFNKFTRSWTNVIIVYFDSTKIPVCKLDDLE